MDLVTEKLKSARASLTARWTPMEHAWPPSCTSTRSTGGSC